MKYVMSQHQTLNHRRTCYDSMVLILTTLTFLNSFFKSWVIFVGIVYLLAGMSSLFLILIVTKFGEIPVLISMREISVFKLCAP